MAAPARTPTPDHSLRVVEPQHAADASARAPRPVASQSARRGAQRAHHNSLSGAPSGGAGSVLVALLAAASDEDLDALAAALAPRLTVAPSEGERDGWLDTRAAEAYAGFSRGRLDDLKRLGKISPAGYDGRKPMYRKDDIDTYLMGPGRRS